MTSKGLGINAHDTGIGTTINQHLLMVPPNQRSYAWEDSHVQTLFEDFSGAITSSEQPYFLGTLVLTQSGSDRLEVADGQQRLATTSILIAAIRDYLSEMGPSEKKAADKYTSDYLMIYDEMSGEHTPRLQLNYEDNDYFLNSILLRNDNGSGEPQISSHKRLYRASLSARRHVENIVSQFARPDKARELYRWVRFIKDSAMVIAIVVPDHINAYTMFETLNDRGLRASQTDILKNSLFGKAQDRLNEIQMKWSSMVSTVETIGDEDLLLTYLRHHWTLTHGYTAERELAAHVKDEVLGKQQAISMVVALDDCAPDYVGLFNPLEYVGWDNIDRETRAYLYIITRILSVEQILPLLLAIIKKFGPVEVRSAAKILLSWSVRYIIAGSGGGGPLDRAYGQMAKDIMTGIVSTAAQMRKTIRAVILRTDAEFEQSFAQARVTKSELARYYLRALELHRQKLDQRPELAGITDDTFNFNLEHVMPQRESTDWPVPEQIAQQMRKRLGNMVLLSPVENVKVGNRSFAEKRAAYAQSPLLLTQEVGRFSQWGLSEIEGWQKELAQMAVEIWPY